MTKSNKMVKDIYVRLKTTQTQKHCVKRLLIHMTQRQLNFLSYLPQSSLLFILFVGEYLLHVRDTVLYADRETTSDDSLRAQSEQIQIATVQLQVPLHKTLDLYSKSSEIMQWFYVWNRWKLKLLLIEDLDIHFQIPLCVHENDCVNGSFF